MMEPLGARRELTSWKEIAVYLDVTERAAQNWERQRGMPVHRLPGPGRGRVMAYTDELDAWKRSGVASVESKTPVPSPEASRRWMVWAAIVVLCLLGGGVAFRGKQVPYSAVLENDLLIVKDSEGKELWRRVFPDTVRKERYQNVVLADLNLDGTPEVLFAYRRSEGDELICFNGQGERVWVYKPGRPIRSQHREYDGSYGIQSFAAARLGREGRMRVVVNGYHMTFSPGQISLLDENGRLLREYWHPGHLHLLSVGDTDGDGRNELYLAGVNNRKGAATLLVLDPDRFGGSAGDDAGQPHFPGLPVSTELGRVLLPRTAMNRGCFPYNAPTVLELQGKTIRVDVNENPMVQNGAPVIVYSMNARLDVEDFVMTDGFRSANHNPCGLRNTPPLPGKHDLRDVVTLTPRRVGSAQARN